jgi:polyhydroxybutyrate depolymerase
MTKPGWLVLVTVLAGAWACSSEPGGEIDGGADSDADTDSDTDTDSDSDSDDTDDPVECPVDGDLGAGDHDLEIEHDGMTRAFTAHVPESYDPAVPTALIVNLHGYTSTGWQQTLFSQMNPDADSAGFVAVYPDGYANSWNAGVCCGDAASENVDDVGFLEAMVDHLATRLCVDRARVFATGMSNGGYMAHRLGCEAADVFAAVAPVAGAMGIAACEPGRGVGVLAFHGVQDTLVEYPYGEVAISDWVYRNNCTGDPTVTEFGGSHCEVWEECDDGVKVSLCTLDPMGHCWPGGSAALCLDSIGPFNDDIDANLHMWDFFLEHPLP